MPNGRGTYPAPDVGAGYAGGGGGGARSNMVDGTAIRCGRLRTAPGTYTLAAASGTERGTHRGG